MSLPGLVHMDAVPEHRVDVGPLSGAWTDLGRAGGSIATGLRRMRLDAGKRSTPVHAHDAEEEVFYVLSGDGLSWQDGKTCTVSGGDCIAHVAGGPAHTLIAGPDGLEALVFSTRRSSPACRLPRAGVAWLGPMWVEMAGEPHPWGRELAAGELDVPAPGERFASVVGLSDVEEVVRAVGDTHVRRRHLALAAGAQQTGLNHVIVDPGKINCPPHVHAAEEEIFLVLGGEGVLLLYPCGPEEGAPEEHAVRAGSVVVRPAGSAVAHAFRAGGSGLTLLAYGERRTDETTYYPRSRKLSMRGLGVVGRLELCGYWDGEPPEV